MQLLNRRILTCYFTNALNVEQVCLCVSGSDKEILTMTMIFKSFCQEKLSSVAERCLTRYVVISWHSYGWFACRWWIFIFTVYISIYKKMFFSVIIPCIIADLCCLCVTNSLASMLEEEIIHYWECTYRGWVAVLFILQFLLKILVIYDPLSHCQCHISVAFYISVA